MAEDTTSMHSASSNDGKAPSATPNVEESGKTFADKGWVPPTPLDYEAIKQLEIADTDTHYHGTAARYEWNDDFGDVGPEIPALEQNLFQNEFKLRKGAHFDNLSFEVEVTGPNMPDPLHSFKEAGLHPVMVDNVTKCGYEVPTPIQRYTIPAILAGNDIVAVSQTGSGKTAAYLIPMISKLMGKVKKLGGPKPKVFGPEFDKRKHGVKAEPLIVIVVPTRELALQVFDEARRLCYRSMMRPCVSYGGLPNRIAFDELARGCDILIATPGRMCAMIDEPANLSLARVKYTVLDEADELVDPSWDENIRKIITGGDNTMDGQYLMFSATFPKQARAIAADYMDPNTLLKIHVGRLGSSHKNIKQEMIFSDQNKKKDALLDLLMGLAPGRTMIFCNTKRAVDEVDDFLYNKHLPVTSIHSDRHQTEREDAMTSFRVGKTPVLVTTGVAARGWDIAGVTYVINFDLPSADHGGIEEYTHRIGRTARIGHQGMAISLYTERNEDIAEKLVNVMIENESKVPDFLEAYLPPDGQPTFDDDKSDAEEEETQQEDDSSWGGAAPQDSAVEEDTSFQPVPADSAAVASW